MTPSESPEPGRYPPGSSSPPLIWSLDDLARASAKLWLWHGRWPSDPVPDDATVYRWLEEAIARGLARKYGRGRRNDPFRYGPRDSPERGCSADDG